MRNPARIGIRLHVILPEDNKSYQTFGKNFDD